METGGKKKAIDQRSSAEDHMPDMTCRCRGCKKTLCHTCSFKLLKGQKTDNPTDEAVTVVSWSGSRKSDSQHWDTNFSEYFSKYFKKVLEIKPKHGSFTIRYFNEKIWAPTGNIGVQVYNKTGINLKTLTTLNYPKSIEKAINGDIFIACYHNCGLYVIYDNGAPQKICEGSFADVYAYGDKVYALEFEKKFIIQLHCRPDIHDVRQRWKNEKQMVIGEAGGNDKLIVTGDEDLELYVSHWDSHRVSVYNAQGQCIKQFGSRRGTGDGNLHCPWLCGIDRQSHLLVADMKNDVYKILDPGTGQWRSARVRGEFWVYDATLDDEGNLWLCQHNGSEFIIAKHEPQLVSLFFPRAKG